MREDKKILSFLFLITLLAIILAGCQRELDISDNSNTEIIAGNNPIIPGIIRVKFNTNQPIEDITKATKTGISIDIEIVDALNDKYRIISIERFFPYVASWAEADRRHGLDRWFEIRFDEVILKGQTLSEQSQEMVSAYSKLGIFEYVEPAYMAEYYGQTAQVSELVDFFSKASKSSNFSDPLLSKQWHYDNINLFGAWEYTTGNANVIIAINDHGVDFEHEDLKDNMWINNGELGGESYYDDDKNGYADDIYGYNFEKETGNLDKGEHATHVAGIIGAISNNAKGVAGIAGGSGSGDGVRLMSCQIVGSEGSNEIGANAAKALRYSAKMGAVISQNSWGYVAPDYYEQVLIDAIDYFIAEAGNYPGSPMKGGVFITSSGNLNSDGDYYPGAYEKVYTVASTNYLNRKSSFSNYGSYIAVSAPGGTNDNVKERNILSTLPDNKYGYMFGTSMACPHVSGVAALLISRFGGEGLSNTKLQEMMSSTATSIEEAEPTYFQSMGEGLINAYEAIKSELGNEQKIAPDAVVDLELIEEDEVVKLLWSIASDEDDGVPAYYDIIYSEESITSENFSDLESKKIQLIRPVAGEKVEKDISFIDIAKYSFFAVVGVDRAGNISDISNIIEYNAIEDDAIRASPSVVVNYVDLKWGKKYSGKIVIDIFNSIGQNQYSIEIEDVNKTRINLSFLGSGIYSVRLRSEMGTTAVRVVKR